MRNKRLLSILCMLALLAGLLPAGMIPAKAADPWINNADVSWIDSSKKLVAFTFDDGPVGTDPTCSSQRILDVMEQYGMHCTYFYVGKEISNARLPEIQRAYSLGCEIGNHTFNHDYLTNLNANQIKEQISRVNDLLYPISGNEETVVRPPYGSTNGNVTSSANVPLINWSLDSADWNNGNYNSVVNNVRNNIRDGSIILFHETYDFTAQAVETLVPELIEKGYVIVSVSELMKMKGITMTRGTVYTNQAVGKANVYTPTPDELVKAKIRAIGEVTLDSAEVISEARSAYEALTEEERNLVENYDVLVAAEKTLEALLVQKKIADIGEVTLDNAAAVSEARSAYDALTEDEKALVGNYNYLTAAEETLEVLYVQKKIADIGEVTPDSASAISEARSAYEALSEEQKAQVENTDTLEAAEAALEDLKPLPFTDVKPGAFYEKAVKWAVKQEITNGMSETAFAPDNPCTRAQVVTFLWRAAGSPEPENTKTAFKDVGETAFYAKAVAWAVENEITNGMSGDRFAPDLICTRAQVVTFLWRVVGRPEPATSENPFTDVKTGFYYNAMLWAVEKDVTKGISATTFRPDAACTRGQIVTFLFRALA